MTVPEPPEQIIRATQSAATPVYVDLSDRSSVEQASSDLLTLVERRAGLLSPDWDAWAEILAFGAPLAGRTPWEGFSRLQPGQYAERRADRWVLRQGSWFWREIEPNPSLEPEDMTEEVLEGLRHEIRKVRGALNPMLSGGRDSRLLTAVAWQLRTSRESFKKDFTVWTTSSDTGTSMEELVAAKVAGTLELPHRIVPALHDEFATDARDYFNAVGYMSSFHVWLMPMGRALRETRGTVLDGLGGGVFLGGGFPDESPALEAAATGEDLVRRRFGRLARYLGAGDEILATGVSRELEERAWADFEPIAADLSDHPNGGTLTAYLTRTLPGISLAPAKVLGSSQDVRVPILADPVVTGALQVENAKKRDGVWYQDLLRKADHRLATIPTAADLIQHRQHLRRGATRTNASWYRDLILASPAGELLSERMRAADIDHWCYQLSRTKSQHLLRGLAMLALWLEAYGSRLTDSQIPFGVRRNV